MAETGASVVILGTGGTIAGRAVRAGDNVGYVAGQVRVEDLVDGIPPLGTWPIEVEQVAQVDSKDMDLAVWQRLLARVAAHLQRPDVQGVVITHGTDTLEETAYLLHAVLRPKKPVVLTCAMRPASALVPDGPQNLLDAVSVARTSGARGVLAVCAGLVHTARDVAKVSSYRLDAFDSGEAGPLGCVEEGRLRLFHPWPDGGAEQAWDADLLERVLRADRLPRVELVTSHADAGGGLVRALLAQTTPPEEALRGLVVAATGNGTLHQALALALQEAQAAGVRVRRSTRCARGHVVPDARQSFEDAAGLQPAKARLALALELLEA